MSDSPKPPGGFERGGAEFSRVLAFSDAVFAIAMTLLIVTVDLPALVHQSNVGELADRLNDVRDSFISFFISFAVIGRYWFAHNQFFALLQRMDSRLLAINLAYLAFIAFLPFPTDLLGNYFENPLSVAIYALTVAIVSTLEAVMFRQAHRAGLLRHAVPEGVYRWGMHGSLAPVLFFLLSVPVAFLSTGVAATIWFMSIPFGALLNRRKPPGADEVLQA
jgi:uncharacterized membrane protein